MDHLRRPSRQPHPASLSNTNTPPQIADGLSALKHPHGGFLDGLTMYSPALQSGATKIAGPAFTVRFVPKADTESPSIQGNYVSREPPLRRRRKRIASARAGNADASSTRSTGFPRAPSSSSRSRGRT